MLKSLVLILALAVSSTNCTAKKVPILVANAAVATADTIGKLSEASEAMRKASVLPAAADLNMQETLLSINTKMKELPEILRTIDRLQLAGESTAANADRAIAILQVVGQDISVTIAGVPLSDVTKPLITLVRAAQQTVQTVLIEVSKIRGREQ